MGFTQKPTVKNKFIKNDIICETKNIWILQHQQEH